MVTNNIDALICSFNKTISDHCTIQFYESKTRQDNNNDKIKCEVPDFKWRTKIQLVEMRLHVGWHKRNNYLNKTATGVDILV